MTSESAAALSSLVGQCLDGRYRLEAQVGSGALGVVYRARHLEQERVVAVKLLHDGGGDSFRRTRFEWEAETIARLAHPNIATILDHGVSIGRPYLVSEWLQGETLAERLSRGPLPIDAALTIMRQLLAALSAVHIAQLRHGNLKPNNVFLQLRKHGPERVKLLDFGLNQANVPVAVAAAARSRRALLEATRESALFTSPEQRAGDPPDARSDVFAAGAILKMMRASGAVRSGASNGASSNGKQVVVSSNGAAKPAASQGAASGAPQSARTIAAARSSEPATARSVAPHPLDPAPLPSANAVRPAEPSAQQSSPGSGDRGTLKKRGRKARRARDAERRSARAREAERAAAAALVVATQPLAPTAPQPEPAPPEPARVVEEAHTTVEPAELADGATPLGSGERLAPPLVGRMKRPPPVVDSVVQALIARATSTQPYQRFADAAEMLCELVDRLPRELVTPPGEQLAPGAAPTSPHGADEAFGGSATLEALASARTSDAALGPRSSLPTLVALPHGDHVGHDGHDGQGGRDGRRATGIAGRAALGVQPLMAAGLIAVGAAVLLLAIALRGDDERPLARRGLEPSQPTAEPAQVASRPQQPALPVPAGGSSETTIGTALAGGPRAVPPVVSAPPKPKPPVVPAAWSQPVLFNSLRQPPARNPWLEPLPPELEGVPTIVASGAEGEDSMVRAIRAYNRNNEQDARGCLLLGYFYVNRLWRSDAVVQFALALQRDPSARGAPEILPVLFELIIHGKAAGAAEELIQKAYGAEALPAIDIALSQVTTTMAAHRLHALSARLAEAEQAKTKPSAPVTR